MLQQIAPVDLWKIEIFNGVTFIQIYFFLPIDQQKKQLALVH